MKTRAIALNVLIVLLFFGATSRAGPAGPDAAAIGVASGGRYRLTSQLAPAAALGVVTVRAGAGAGGSYRLTSLPWRADAVSSGGAYRLTGPASPSGGNPCCCSYLPCVVRTY